MKVNIQESKEKMGKESGKLAAALIRQAIKENGGVNLILATGASQFEVLAQLTSEENIDWGKATMFHLDEYIGLPISHKASFRKYLKERFLDKVPPLKNVFLINGETDPEEERNHLGKLIKKHPVDVALVGIGENGHLAFNDPPADFDIEEPYLVVDLAQTARQQQVNEGWFASLGEVPKQAISMSVKQIMLSKNIICTVPDLRKAQAVKACLEGEVTNLHPASILRQHANCHLFMDTPAASLLTK